MSIDEATQVLADFVEDHLIAGEFEDDPEYEKEREALQAVYEDRCIKEKTHFKKLVPKGGYDYCFYCGGK